MIDRLALHPSQHFADRPAWPAHLEALGLTRLEVTPAAGSQGRPPVVAPERRAVKIATEGALWGTPLRTDHQGRCWEPGVP